MALKVTKNAAAKHAAFASLIELRGDIRYAFRTVRKNAGFALVAVLVLAIGAGVNLSCFAALCSMVLRPVLGRTFTAAECEPGHDGVVVVSHGFWRTRLASGDREDDLSRRPQWQITSLLIGLRE